MERSWSPTISWLGELFLLFRLPHATSPSRQLLISSFYFIPQFFLFHLFQSYALSLQVHYAIHRPEPHILLYRRPKGYGQNPAPVAAPMPQAAPVPMVQ